MKQILLIIATIGIPVHFLNCTNLSYTIRNKSDKTVSISVVADRDMQFVKKDPSRDNDIYTIGINISPNSSKFADFTITGKSTTFGAFKKHWGIKEIHVKSWGNQPGRSASQIIQLDQQENDKPLIITIENPTDISTEQRASGSEKVVVSYEVKEMGETE
jgi:hypothetical protein